VPFETYVRIKLSVLIFPNVFSDAVFVLPHCESLESSSDCHSLLSRILQSNGYPVT
jgi:hypothetical protein